MYMYFNVFYCSLDISFLLKDLDQPGAPRILELEEMLESKLFPLFSRMFQYNVI